MESGGSSEESKKLGANESPRVNPLVSNRVLVADDLGYVDAPPASPEPPAERASIDPQGHYINREANLDLDLESQTRKGDNPNTKALGNEDALKTLINTHPVLVISKSTCPFCYEMKSTLRSYGVKYSVLEIDKAKFENYSMGDIQNYLAATTGIRTVPHLYVNGESIGGCNDLKRMELSGELKVVLGPYFTGRPEPRRRVTSMGLFYFPETANGNVVRLTAFFTAVYTLLCVIFYKNDVTPYALLAICIDCCFRVIFGATASPLASLAAMCTSHMKPAYTAGPAKQFAAFCALFFSTFATGLFLGGEDVGGAVVTALWLGSASLEFLFDFCLGCWMYGLGIKFGFIPKNIYAPYTNMLPLRKWTYDFMNVYLAKKLDAPYERVYLPDQSVDTPIDLIRKSRIETEYKNQDFNIVRHTRIDLFSIPMTLATLAYVYKVIDKGSVNPFTGEAIKRSQWQTVQVFYVLVIIAATLFCIFTILYIVHFVRHTEKVFKEWFHPIQGNFFAAFTIAGTLFGICDMYRQPVGGVTLVWLGGVGQMLMTVLRISDLVYGRTAEEFLNPALMMAPVGNFIAAIGFSLYQTTYPGPKRDNTMNYTFIARLWFGVAALFAIVLFTMTFRKAILDHHSDERVRFSLWVWLATAATSGPAYLAVNDFDPAIGRGVLFQSLYCIAIFFAVLLTVGWVKGFFVYVSDMSMWIQSFSLCALALNAAQYYFYVNDKFSEVLVYIAVATASASTAISIVHTGTWLIEGSLFKPRPKWGPINFMKLTHECLRFSIPQLTMQLEALGGKEGKDPVNPFALDVFIKDFEEMIICYLEHGRHEDEIIFPSVRRYFPHLNPTMDEEHEYEHQVIEEMTAAVRAYKEYEKNDANSSRAAASYLLHTLKELFPGFGVHVLRHLRNEEATVTVAARKYLPVEAQTVITNAAYRTTSAEAWAVIFPFVLRNLPVPGWKVRYVRCFLWPDPSRAQEIGLILYRGCDSVTWSFLAREIPEIVPRGLLGHRKIY